MTVHMFWKNVESLLLHLLTWASGSVVSVYLLSSCSNWQTPGIVERWRGEGRRLLLHFTSHAKILAILSFDYNRENYHPSASRVLLLQLKRDYICFQTCAICWWWISSNPKVDKSFVNCCQIKSWSQKLQMLTFEQVKFLGNLKTLSSAENQLQLESEMWLCDGVNMQWEKHRKNPSSTHFWKFCLRRKFD